MSTFKWFLLTVCLVLGPEVSSKMWSPSMNQPNGVYCNRICETHRLAGQTAVCFVVYERNIKLMVARNPSLTQWKFYPMNSGNQHILIRNPENLCDRIRSGDGYNGRRTCYTSVNDKTRHVFNFGGGARHVFDFGGNTNSFNVTVLNRKDRNCNNLRFMSLNDRKDLSAEIEVTIAKALENIKIGGKRSASDSESVKKDVKDIVKRLEKIRAVANAVELSENVSDLRSVSMGINQGVLPENMTSYTPEKWANITATLKEVRDEGEKNEQPDLKKLVYALDVVLPVLDAVNITSETKTKPANEKYLRSLVDMMRTIGVYTAQQNNELNGNKQEGAKPDPLPTDNSDKRQEEKKSIADDLNLRMEKVKEDAATSDIEVPKELIDNMDKEVKRLSSALNSPKKTRSDFSFVLKLIKNILVALGPFMANTDGNFGNQLNPPNYSPTPNPMNDEKYPSMSNPMTGENYPPISHPTIGTKYPPMSNSMTGEKYPPISHPMMADKYPSMSNPMTGEKYPPMSYPMMDEKYPPVSNTMMGDKYPSMSNPTIGEKYSPVSNPMMGDKYPSMSKPMTGKNYPPISHPMIGEKYPPMSNSMTGEKYPPISHPMMADKYPSMSNSMTGEKYPPMSYPMMDEKYPPVSNTMMGDKYPSMSNPTIGERYSFMSNHMMGRKYPGRALRLAMENFLTHSQPRPPLNPPYMDVGSPQEMCESARKFFCEETFITVYTYDNYFCWASLKKSNICKRLSRNCFQDLDFMLDPLQNY